MPDVLTVFFDERTLAHDTGRGMWETVASPYLAEQERHPENPVRIRNMVSALTHGPVSEAVEWRDGRLADERELAAVHDPDYVTAIRRLCAGGGGRLTGTTVVSKASWEPLLAAAGTCLEAAESVLVGTSALALALVRPPGHHAQPAQADGFCVFSHASLVADKAREAGRRRVAVIDWDVHHGNGTQACFYDRRDVLTVSFHMAHGAWGSSHPQTGRANELGVGPGEGYNVNVELPVGAGDRAYSRALSEVVAPVLEEFQPDFLIGACGQDASAFDPEGRHNVTMAGFFDIGRQFRALADRHTDGRAVLVQEGGYARSYAAYCLHATVEGVLGRRRQLDDPLAYVPDDTSRGEGALEECLAALAPHWGPLASRRGRDSSSLAETTPDRSQGEPNAARLPD